MSISKRALITGIGGQDAYYMCQLLLKHGYDIVGTSRSGEPFLGVGGGAGKDTIDIEQWDLLDQKRFADIVVQHEPALMFNLAAFSSGENMNGLPVERAKVNGLAVLAMLETLRCVSPSTRFVQASSAEVFGDAVESPQTELSARNPRSVYGVAKLFADGMIKLYRERHGLFCASAILYNHESPRRERSFVTRKITSAAAAILAGEPKRLLLGNLSAKRDWGHARDYADGMWRITQADQIDDYVFATGETHTVREFVELAFRCVGIELDWHGEGLNEAGVCHQTGDVCVAVSEEYFRPLEAEPLIGNPAKAKAQLGWEPTTPFEDIVREMIDADLKRLSVDLPQKKPRQKPI
jgi:GDPmannose 4,6-dehydratase